MSPSSLSRCSPFDDYLADQVLTLNVLPDHGHVSASAMQVRIRQLHTRTFSCTMVVDILEEERPSAASGIAFLKLFDRRFADGLRRNNGIKPWTQGMEEAYIDSVKSGAINSYLHDLTHIDLFEESRRTDRDDAQNEAFLAHKLLRQYNAEIALYDGLRDQQGDVIPKVVAAVDLDLELATSSGTPSRCDREDFEPFRVKGILLEHIDGCNLLDIVDHFPRSSWQDIVNQAIAIVGMTDDRNILNTDVRPRNFLVCTDPDGRRHPYCKVFMIDFGMSRFRGPDESDAEWGRAKHGEDEECAVGIVMKSVLSDHGFELPYEPSSKYYEWAETEDTEDSFYEHAIKTEVSPGVVVYSLPPEENAE